MAMPDHDAVLTEEDVPPGAIVREGAYGERVVAVEPGGAECIPLHERHGKPLQLFWTWSSPNMEFATIFVGVLAVAAFGLNFSQRPPEDGSRPGGRGRLSGTGSGRTAADRLAAGGGRAAGQEDGEDRGPLPDQHDPAAVRRRHRPG